MGAAPRGPVPAGRHPLQCATPTPVAVWSLFLFISGIQKLKQSGRPQDADLWRVPGKRGASEVQEGGWRREAGGRPGRTGSFPGWGSGGGIQPTQAKSQLPTRHRRGLRGQRRPRPCPDALLGQARGLQEEQSPRPQGGRPA